MSSLLLAAVKKVAAVRIAEFILDIQDEMDRQGAETTADEKDESATHVHLEPENPDLLAGAVIARRFGFGLPEHPGAADGARDTLQDH